MSIAEEQPIVQETPPAPIAPAVEPAPPRLEPTAPPRHRRRWLHRLLLLAIILVGGVMRFSFLEKPPIWFDEAATFGRVCGTYQQMLDALEEAGFGPLHYHLEWWIKNGLPTWGKIERVRVWATVVGDGLTRVKRGAGADGKVDANNLVPRHQLVSAGKVTLTPFFLRLGPAICGTLMIPAMYWLYPRDDAAAGYRAAGGAADRDQCLPLELLARRQDVCRAVAVRRAVRGIAAVLAAHARVYRRGSSGLSPAPR
jgi:hypothetical protein